MWSTFVFAEFCRFKQQLLLNHPMCCWRGWSGRSVEAGGIPLVLWDTNAHRKSSIRLQMLHRQLSILGCRTREELCGALESGISALVYFWVINTLQARLTPSLLARSGSNTTCQCHSALNKWDNWKYIRIVSCLRTARYMYQRVFDYQYLFFFCRIHFFIPMESVLDKLSLFPCYYVM